MIIRIERYYNHPDLKRQTPQGSLHWKDFTFTEEPVEACDYLVILEYPKNDFSVKVNPNNIIHICSEPPNEISKYRQYANKKVALIFNQLDIPLDFSFNYQPGQNGRDIFDAAISAQLFDNRVIVNGNIGSSRYTNQNSDVVGDIDVEIKLDDKGRFRAKAFSHSADQYSNYLDNSQRSGVGLVYQEEFNSFRELFNRLFRSKKKREKVTK